MDNMNNNVDNNNINSNYNYNNVNNLYRTPSNVDLKARLAEKAKIEQEQKRIQEEKQYEYSTKLAYSRAKQIVNACLVLSMLEILGTLYYLGFKIIFIILHLLVCLFIFIAKKKLLKEKKSAAINSLTVSIVNESMLLIIYGIIIFIVGISISGLLYVEYLVYVLILSKIALISGMVSAIHFIKKSDNPELYKDKNEVFYDKYEEGMSMDFDKQHYDNPDIERSTIDTDFAIGNITQSDMELKESTRYYDENSDVYLQGKITNTRNDIDYDEDFEDIERKF